MKAQELRIGNFIKDSMTGSIDEIDLDFFHDLAKGGFDLDYFDLIPLNEEWIERFGFKYYEHGYEWRLPDRILDLEETDAGYLYDSRLLVKSVHQLQNLYFALTGQELTYK